LSLFSGVNCRSLTPAEFMELPLLYDSTKNAASGETAGSTDANTSGSKRSDESLLTPAFLCRLFRTWDTLRFCGRGVDKIDLFQALKAAESFIAALDRAEREQPFPALLWGSSQDPSISEDLADVRPPELSGIGGQVFHGGERL